MCSARVLCDERAQTASNARGIWGSADVARVVQLCVRLSGCLLPREWRGGAAAPGAWCCDSLGASGFLRNDATSIAPARHTHDVRRPHTSVAPYNRMWSAATLAHMWGEPPCPQTRGVLKCPMATFVFSERSAALRLCGFTLLQPADWQPGHFF